MSNIHNIVYSVVIKRLSEGGKFSISSAFASPKII